MRKTGWIVLSVVLALALVAALVFWLGAPHKAVVQPSLSLKETRVVDHTDLFAKAHITAYDTKTMSRRCSTRITTWNTTR